MKSSSNVRENIYYILLKKCCKIIVTLLSEQILERDKEARISEILFQSMNFLRNA